MSVELTSQIESAIQSLIRTAEIAFLYGEEDEKNVETYLQLLEKLLKVKCNAEVANTALIKSKESEMLEDFDQKYQSEKQKIKIPDISKSKAFKTYSSQIKAIFDPDPLPGNSAIASQCDDIEIQGEISEIDPFTKQRMKHPVKNKKCGHYYEQDSVFQSIAINSRIRCPYSGCKNVSFLRKNDLEVDHAFARRLHRTDEVSDEED